MTLHELVSEFNSAPSNSAARKKVINELYYNRHPIYIEMYGLVIAQTSITNIKTYRVGNDGSISICTSIGIVMDTIFVRNIESLEENLNYANAVTLRLCCDA